VGCDSDVAGACVGCGGCVAEGAKVGCGGDVGGADVGAAAGAQEARSKIPSAMPAVSQCRLTK
jgi:hypothetical protein